MDLKPEDLASETSVTPSSSRTKRGVCGGSGMVAYWDGSAYAGEMCPGCEACERSEMYLECPCCGDDGAVSDSKGLFVDGQALICGCPGWVSVDSEGDDDPYINNGDAECLKCGVVGLR